MKVAVDTNVLVSAAIADGPPRRILELAAEGDFDLVVSQYALRELERILTEKLGLDREAVFALLELVEELCPIPIPTPEAVTALSGDPDDDKIIAASTAAGADYLVSGDTKHVLPLGRLGEMQILRPQDLLARLRS